MGTRTKLVWSAVKIHKGFVTQWYENEAETRIAPLLILCFRLFISDAVSSMPCYYLCLRSSNLWQTSEIRKVLILMPRTGIFLMLYLYVSEKLMCIYRYHSRHQKKIIEDFIKMTGRTMCLHVVILTAHDRGEGKIPGMTILVIFFLLTLLSINVWFSWEFYPRKVKKTRNG